MDAFDDEDGGEVGVHVLQRGEGMGGRGDEEDELEAAQRRMKEQAADRKQREMDLAVGSSMSAAPGGAVGSDGVEGGNQQLRKSVTISEAHDAAAATFSAFAAFSGAGKSGDEDGVASHHQSDGPSRPPSALPVVMRPPDPTWSVEAAVAVERMLRVQVCVDGGCGLSM